MFFSGFPPFALYSPLAAVKFQFTFKQTNIAPVCGQENNLCVY